MRFKIVADSSADIKSFGEIDFSAAPLKIVTDDREFVDDGSLDVEEMVEYLDKYKGRSSTSCPNADDWLRAFGDAERVFCVTITGALSGSHNSACMAKKLYEERYPNKRVCVIDSLSTGPEMLLIIEKLAELIKEGKDFDCICGEISQYQKKTALLFVLESMKNLANNGRVSKISARVAGIMNIRVVGRASEKGELEPLDKPRGEKMTLQRVVERLKDMGYCGGKLRITDCLNKDAAEKLRAKIQTEFRGSDVRVGSCGGLCSFYAERGGLLVGFETV